MRIAPMNKPFVCRCLRCLRVRSCTRHAQVHKQLHKLLQTSGADKRPAGVRRSQIRCFAARFSLASLPTCPDLTAANAASSKRPRSTAQHWRSRPPVSHDAPTANSQLRSRLTRLTRSYLAPQFASGSFCCITSWRLSRGRGRATEETLARRSLAR